MSDLWSPERDFQGKSIKEKLKGSTVHRYEQPHLSKRDLSDAVGKITEAVQGKLNVFTNQVNRFTIVHVVLFARAASNNQKQKSQREYVSSLGKLSSMLVYLHVALVLGLLPFMV